MTMKKKALLLLTAAIAWIGLSDVVAATTTKKYLKLTDSEFVVNRWWNGTNNNTVSDDGTQLYIYGQPGGVEGVTECYGGQAGWNFGEPVSTADWDKLVMKLKNAGPAKLQARMTDGEYEFSQDIDVDSDKVVTYEFPLASLEGSKWIDNVESKGTISSITSVYFWGYYGGGNTVTLDEIYFEKTVADTDAKDYEEVNVLEGNGFSEATTINGTEISFSQSGEKWSYDVSGINSSLYKYLVVVPKVPYVQDENGMGDIQYGLSDGSNADVCNWSFAYGWWQARHACVLNIGQKRLYDTSSEESYPYPNDTDKEKSGYTNINEQLDSVAFDLGALKSIYFLGCGNYKYNVSAIYFTNERPTYDNRWNGISADYSRETSATDTYGTICLPYASAICGAQAYSVAGVDSKNAPTKLYLKEENGILKAGVPYIFKTNSEKKDADSYINGGGVFFTKAGANTVTTPDDNALEGNLGDADADVPATSFVLASDGSWKSADNATIGQYEAFLTLTDVEELSDATGYVEMAIASTPTTDTKDYEEIDLSKGTATGNASMNGRTITLSDGDARYGWDVSDINTANYDYMVIVPRKPFLLATDTYDTYEVRYGISDGTNNIYGWGFAYGYWNTHRALVYSIKDNIVYSNSNDSSFDDKQEYYTSRPETFGDIKNVYLTCGYSSPVNFEVSAIYFSNTKPTFNNYEWYADNELVGDYKREATNKDTYGTICLPYAAAVCGANVYKVVGVDSKDSPSKLYLEEVYGVLEAGVPYIFKSNTDTDINNDTKTLTFGGGVVFYKAGSNVAAAPIDNALHGNLGTENMTVPESSYILTSNGKWGKGSNNYVASNRAYLTLTDDLVVSEDEANAAKYIVMSLDGGRTTGISNVESEQETSSAVYNLNGTRVANPAKGIYIKNGKKIAIK